MRTALYIFAILALFVASCTGERSAQDSATRLVMETDAGAIMIELYPERAPVTVANFLAYVDAGQLDGAAFYRTTRADNDPMITVIQGGLWRPWHDDGDEGFEALRPPIIHETTEQSGLTHSDGVISMARNEPGSASSEFFISVGDNASLDYGGARNPDGQGFAAFGKVVDGMDVVRAINHAPTREGEGFAGQLLAEPVRILSVTRERKPR